MTNLTPLSPLPPSQPTTQTTNQAATLANKVIAGAESGIVGVAENLAIAAQSWLGYPGIKQIWEAFFGFVADKFTRAFQTGATFIIVDHQVDGELSGVSKELAAVVAAEKTGDVAAITAAIKAYADAYSILMHDDGSAHPTV